MNRIRRSKTNRVLAGICGGIGEYFNIDPTIIRLALVVLGFPSFGTVGLVYLISTFVIPEDDGIIYDDAYEQNEKTGRNTSLVVGLALIIWGGILLGKMFFPWFTLNLAALRKFWPVLLILSGIYVLVNRNDR